MKTLLLVTVFIFLFSNIFSQNEKAYKMRKVETNNILIETKYTSDTVIDLSEEGIITSLAISGKIKLNNSKSLIRVILITEEHEYLVYEAFSLIAEDKEFFVNEVCEETSLLNSEKLLELMVIVRNAEFEFKKIHYSSTILMNDEKSNYDEITKEKKQLDEKFKTSKINRNNYKKSKTWVAGITEISQIPFEKKKNLFGGNYDFHTGGFEYYDGGIFSLEDFNPKEQANFKSVTTNSYVSEFDWRNRHGQNWNTSVKNQTYNCGSCWAFTAVAVVESNMNLLYNNANINLDLSEQDVLSCTGYSNNCAGGWTDDALTYIKNTGVVNENCFPYTATDEACSYKCTSPSEVVQVDNVYNIYNIDEFKYNLINNGPLGSGFWFSYGGGHAMALVGYNTINVGDIIRYVDNNGYGIDSTIQEGNPLIGQEYWIFKNSYGTDNRPNDGYMYLFLNDPSDLIIGSCITRSFSNQQYTQNCTDNDFDGYYWWGTGEKPSTCPACTPDEPDGDDSNPNYGPMDEYGNLESISQPYQYSDVEVSSSETWTSDVSTCGDIVVTSSGKLTINGSIISLEGNSSFQVEIGGELLMNEGSIE